MTTGTPPARWQDIEPRDAVDINLTARTDITAPLNENGDRCPWPWEPQQLTGVPLGQYRCGYCMAMCVAGMPHPDYSPMIHPLIGKTVTVTIARKGDPVDDSNQAIFDGADPARPTLAADVTYTGTLLAATYDGEARLDCPDISGQALTVWPALDITETISGSTP